MLVSGRSVEQGLGAARDLMTKMGISDGDLVQGAYIDLLETSG